MIFWKRKKACRVTPIGRAEIEYAEKKKVVTIGSEYLNGGDYDMVIYLSHAETWNAPHDHELLGSEQRARIQEHISIELKNMRLEWA